MRDRDNRDVASVFQTFSPEVSHCVAGQLSDGDLGSDMRVACKIRDENYSAQDGRAARTHVMGRQQ